MSFDGCIEIGSAPAMESCAQVGSPDYEELSKLECRAFITAIKRKLGEPPDGAFLTIKSSDHDFGRYRQVAVKFDEDDSQAVEWAYKVDAEAPQTWDEVSMSAPTSGKGRQI